jgi:hypothetical protein
MTQTVHTQDAAKQLIIIGPHADGEALVAAMHDVLARGPGWRLQLAGTGYGLDNARDDAAKAVALDAMLAVCAYGEAFAAGGWSWRFEGTGWVASPTFALGEWKRARALPLADAAGGGLVSAPYDETFMRELLDGQDVGEGVRVAPSPVGALVEGASRTDGAGRGRQVRWTLRG